MTPFRLNARRLIETVGRKELFIPRDGWTAASFRAHGGPMVITLARVARIVTRQQTAETARRLAPVLDQFVEDVIARAFRQHSHPFRRSVRPVKADLDLPGDEGLWSEAIEEVLKEFDPKVKVKVTAPIQSTLDQGYSKTSILLGQEANTGFNAGLQVRARDIAQRVTRIKETTRKRLQAVIKRSIDEGLSMLDTASAIRKVMPRINANRAMTIARTEVGNAWTQGAIQSFKENSTITLVSVIGCESREVERWGSPSYAQFLYRGESTCNIQDVPVADAGKLNFHPNHTGTIVPSGFADA